MLQHSNFCSLSR